MSAQVTGDALPAVEELDGALGVSGVELVPDEGVGDGVVVALEFDVIVDVHADLFPLGEDVGLGAQRPQRRAVDGLEGAASRAGEFSERTRIEPFEPFGDGAVEFAEGEECAVSQRGEDPSLDHLHADFSLGLVAGTAHPSGEDGEAVVLGEVGVGGVGVGLVAMRASDGRLEIVGHDDLGDTVEEAQRTHVRGAPVGQGLGPGRLGEGVVRRPEHGDEDLRVAQLPGDGVHDRYALASVVDEQLLAGAVGLAHHHVDAPAPHTVALAELAVLQSLGMLGFVLLPQQRQGDPWTAAFGVDLSPIRNGPLDASRHLGAGE